MRLLNRSPLFNDRPFAGQGASLYASIGGAVQYRNLRVSGGARRRPRSGWIKGSGGVHDLAAESVPKTARLDALLEPAAEFTTVLPADYHAETVTFDVRTFRDDVENETDNFRALTVPIDAGGNANQAILGTALFLSADPRAGGVVRLRVRWSPSRDGLQPDRFHAIRTAGPTSPVDQVLTYDGVSRILEIDTPPLSDAAPYTYKIVAEDSAAAVTSDLLTGLTVQADATGPPAPTLGSAVPW